MGLNEVTTPSSTLETVNFVTNSDVTPYVPRDVPCDAPRDVADLTQQIEELTQKLGDAEARSGKLAEACRDKDLKLDLLETEVHDKIFQSQAVCRIMWSTLDQSQAVCRITWSTLNPSQKVIPSPGAVSCSVSRFHCWVTIFLVSRIDFLILATT